MMVIRYEGEMKNDEKHGVATYRWPDSSMAVVKYAYGEPVGEGARWSADRRRTYRLEAGKKVERIPLEKAERIAARIAPVPRRDSTGPAACHAARIER